jgi:hypothetical protein
MGLYELATPVPIKNTGANDCPAFGVLRITDSDRNEGKEYLEVNRPDGTYRHTYIIAGPQGVKAGKYGVGYFAFNSPVWALWDEGATTPAVGDVFGPMLNSFRLNSDGYGFRIIGQSETSPFRRVLVLQQPPDGLHGTLDGTLSYQGSQTVSVRRFVSGSSQPDTSMNVTAHDGYLTSGQSLSNNQGVDLELRGGRWVVTQTRGCPS